MSGLLFDVFVALLVALVAWFVYSVRDRYNVWLSKGVYFIRPSFPFGNYKEWFMHRASVGEIARRIYASTEEPAVGIFIGITPSLLIRDPKIVRQILISDFSTFDDRGMYCDVKRDPLSGHLFSLPADKWRPLRNKLSPTFSSGKLKAMFSTIVDCGAALDSHVARFAADCGTVDMRELLGQYMTNVIASVAFGIDVDCIADPDAPFFRYGRQMTSPSRYSMAKRTFAVFARRLFDLTSMKLFDADIENFFMSLVQTNMELREQQKVTRKDFFQLLVQLRNTDAIQADDVWETKIASDARDKTMSIAECAAQVFVFFVGGFETTAATQSFCLYELAKNAALQKRAQEEVDEVLAKHNGALTYEAASEMKYLDLCIDETLRKYPPLPLLNRKAATDWPLPNSEFTLDRGTSIVIPVLGLHNDPKYYPEPDRFIPERFSPEQSVDKTAHNRPYLPFGDGPRNCIGLRLGKMQTKVGLILMLAKYQFEMTDAVAQQQPLVMNPTSTLLQPIGGIPLRVSKRILI